MEPPPYDSPSRQTPQLPLRHPYPTTSPVMSQIIRGQSQLDEGFSEETRSQSDSDMMYSAIDPSDPTAAQKVLQAYMALPAEQREWMISEGVIALDSLAKGRVNRQLTNLTHFDPAHYLPNEVFLQIFSYLSPDDLLSASTISRDWRIRSQDEKLWRGCFAREGWVLDRAKMEEFEKFAQKKGQKMAEDLTRRAMPPLERRGSRKRKTEEAFSGDESPGAKTKVDDEGSATSAPRSDGAEDSSRPESAQNSHDQMEGLEVEGDDGMVEPVPWKSNNPTPTSSQDSLAEANTPSSPADFKLQPTLLQPGRGQAKVSWPYLYKQRRRLEANWEKGFYTMFQLPHRDHPSEGHEECVYTIQHTNRHLVSGSRDKTIRIWDLSTNRLKCKPLRGHDASVLCLQFDDRPEHDIIVSGGSDAYVIIWKFSTGEVIKKMDRAHDESVLNLRFDDRYIVTCSKDKSIKIWNRHELTRDSPLIPTHVLPSFNNPTIDLTQPIDAFSLLATFTGHHAAVNAVMIHDTTIVSASGDRTIKAWDLHTGLHKKSYNGHQKGIACVQFDGRRIVSGSSDNTVRIFDAEQQAEIACLAGHGNLVRTVQARFGDLETTTDAELLAEAREADRRFYKALSKGMQPATASRRGPRNAGSSRPEDMQSVGTKIPPGGGGSRWAKIVSGSYDETVIVWKRDSEGKWQVKLRLNQDQLLRGNRASRRRDQLPVPAPGQQPGQMGPAAHGHLNHVQHMVHNQQHLNNGPVAQPLQLPTMANAQNTLNAQLQHATAQQQQQQAQGQGQGHQTTVTTTTAGPTTTFTAHQPQTHQQGAAADPNNPFNLPPGTRPPLHPHLHQQLPPGTVMHYPAAHLNQQPYALTPAQAQAALQQHNAAQPGPANAPNPNQPAPQQQQQQAAQQGQQGQQQQNPAARMSSESNRVFKLQFDARRIVCCSQNRTIVGWDFANGDEELERVGEWSLETA